MSTHPRILLGLLASLLAVSTMASSTASPAAAGSGPVAATLDGAPIPLSQVGNYYCHDLAFPIVTCFSTPAAATRDEDARVHAAKAMSPLVTLYVVWYRDINYGGPWFAAYNSYPDLSTIGWSNTISSFDSYNGANPHWYLSPNYGGAAVSWGANASVANVGVYNDRFESVTVP